MEIIYEASDVFGDDLNALALACSIYADETARAIIKDFEARRFGKYESVLTKVVDTFTREDVERFRAMAKVDYTEALRTLEMTAEWLRLSEFEISKKKAREELENIEKINEVSGVLYEMLLKITGKKEPVKKKPVVRIYGTKSLFEGMA